MPEVKQTVYTLAYAELGVAIRTVSEVRDRFMLVKDKWDELVKLENGLIEFRNKIGEELFEDKKKPMPVNYDGLLFDARSQMGINIHKACQIAFEHRLAGVVFNDAIVRFDSDVVTAQQLVEKYHRLFAKDK